VLHEKWDGRVAGVPVVGVPHCFKGALADELFLNMH
jgi:hypothetical protein